MSREAESQEETCERGYTAAVRRTERQVDHAEIVESTPAAKIVDLLDACRCPRAARRLRRCPQHEVRPPCGVCAATMMIAIIQLRCVEYSLQHRWKQESCGLVQPSCSSTLEQHSGAAEVSWTPSSDVMAEMTMMGVCRVCALPPITLVCRASTMNYRLTYLEEIRYICGASAEPYLLNTLSCEEYTAGDTRYHTPLADVDSSITPRRKPGMI